MSKKIKPENALATRIGARGARIGRAARRGGAADLSVDATSPSRAYGEPRKYDYTRSGNPTRDQLGAALADLEGGAGAVVTCTGMAAITLILATVGAGRARARAARLLRRHLPAARGAARAGQARGRFRRSGRCRARSRAALAAKPQLVWIETPSNPLLRIVDIRGDRRGGATRAGALVVADNTFLSPALAAAARARRRPGRAFDHQVPRTATATWSAAR